MSTTRFKGESGSDRLGVSTISDSDMIQVRHKPGTVDDADKGVSKAVLNSCPFGVSSTAAATAAKTAALTDSNPDFTLISGREVVVCFSAANSASSPTLNFAGSGAYPMYYPDGTAIGNWDAGTWMHLKYFEATINETLTQRWIALSPVVTNAITSGDKRPAASGAVYTELRGRSIFKVTPTESKRSQFSVWGLGLCIGNIDGAGNFGFWFSSYAGTITVENLTGVGTLTPATVNNNKITVGTTSYNFTIRYDSGYLIFEWGGTSGNYKANISILSCNSNI